MSKPIIKITITLLCITFFSCKYIEDDLPDIITNEINGKYLYKYPTGQIEVMYVNNDSTFHQEFFMSEKEYLDKATPIFKNTGKWSISGKDIGFNDLLVCSDFGVDFDTLKNKPHLSSFSDACWRKPKYNRKDYKLYFYFENGYVFTKQKDSIPIYHDRNSRW